METKPRLEKVLRIGFKLGFVSIFRFSVLRARSPLPPPRSSTIRHGLEQRKVDNSFKKEPPFPLNKK